MPIWLDSSSNYWAKSESINILESLLYLNKSNSIQIQKGLTIPQKNEKKIISSVLEIEHTLLAIV